MNWISIFFWLLVAHACTDVWWQDVRIIFKKHRLRQLYNSEGQPLPEEPVKFMEWTPYMLAHALINGAGVAFVTGNVWLGIAETIVHGVTDTLKCEHKIDLWGDQMTHLVSKLMWAYAVVV